ncbi:MAG: UDP-2,3-diacylglucosamine diphosphatase LpxI [Phycisphaerae bacterium]|nr:UDP-2,3-diacylglucosamine diphosphatase LpxI [Phycisphaerae bacterium]
MADEQTEPIGLIAGQGSLPLAVARGIKAAGHPLVVVALRDQADAGLAELADSFAWAGITRLSKWIRVLRRGGASRAVMIGRVSKRRMFAPLRVLRYWPDWRAVRLFFFRLRHDRRNEAVLRGLADELACGGIHLIDSTQFCREALASPGPMTRRPPTPAEQADIEFARPLLARIAELDIGQSIAVRDREVIAVEAVEGTDRMIERAGALCPSGGWVMLKIAKAHQDMRFDVPTIGPRTIERLHAAGGKVAALQADKVLIAEREETLALAEKLGIAIVGVE